MFYAWNVREFRFSDKAFCTERDAEFASACFGKREYKGSQRVKSDVLGRIAAVQIVFVYCNPLGVLLNGNLCRSGTRLYGVEDEASDNVRLFTL